MAEVGVLAYGRTELVDGFVWSEPLISPRKANGIHRIYRLFERSLRPASAHSRMRSPLLVDAWTLAEADYLIVRGDICDYTHGHPEPHDALLLVEVSEETGHFDRTTKLATYAAANLREYWIVDLNADCVEVYREPRGESYGSKQTFAADDEATFAPLALPEAHVRAEDLLP
jgi:Uma2 family endonuclease